MLLQALVSFVGDCPDTEMLEDVLSALQEALHHGSPTHQPLVSCLEMHGGERLFMSLLQREDQGLRLLGLQILTAFQNNPVIARGKQGRMWNTPSSHPRMPYTVPLIMTNL